MFSVFSLSDSDILISAILRQINRECGTFWNIRSLLVAGNLPDGYIWHMLVQCGDNFNIVLMEPIEDTASAVADLPEEDGEPEKKPKLIGAVLERGWVGESGKYSVQLRGVKGEEVRHTNLITIRIPK